MSYDDLINQLARQHQGEIDAAKVELALWTQVKARSAPKQHETPPPGLELVVTVDGQLRWAQAFAPQMVEPLLESAATAQQKVLLADGWQPAGRRGQERDAGGGRDGILHVPAV